jgi:transcriptional regulator with GAF, ATPase, and Fis domain
MEIEKVAGTDSTVLLLETGTGKELFAATIHELARGDRMMVRVNCAAIRSR